MTTNPAQKSYEKQYVRIHTSYNIDSIQGPFQPRSPLRSIHMDINLPAARGSDSRICQHSIPLLPSLNIGLNIGFKYVLDKTYR